MEKKLKEIYLDLKLIISVSLKIIKRWMGLAKESLKQDNNTMENGRMEDAME